MEAALPSPFAVKRAIYLLVVPLTIFGFSVHLGQAVLGMVLMAVACWPFPFRLQTSSEGVQVWWLFLTEEIGWKEIRSVQLGMDDRKFVVGSRKPVLVLERFGNPSVTLRGKARVLSEIAGEISSHLEGDAPGRSNV
jgi:hypothetical protein